MMQYTWIEEFKIYPKNRSNKMSIHQFGTLDDSLKYDQSKGRSVVQILREEYGIVKDGELDYIRARIKDMKNNITIGIGETTMRKHRDEETTYNGQQVLKDTMKDVLDKTMESTRFNQVKAAKSLGISRGTLRKLLKVHHGDKYIK